MLAIDKAIERFESLSSNEKAKALLQIAYQFTIAARDVSTQSDHHVQRDKLVALNEVQHKLLSQIQALLKDGTVKYPDKDFILVLEDVSKRAGMLPYLQGALAKVL